MKVKPTLEKLPVPSAWPIMHLPSESLTAEFDETNNLSSVPTKVNYVTPETGLIYTRRDISGSDSELIGANWVNTDVRVGNARGKTVTLDENGFELRRSDVSHMDINFLDNDDVTHRYYTHCEQLVKEALKSSSKGGVDGGKIIVRAFDHNVRKSGASVPASGTNTKTEPKKIINGNGSVVQQPAGLVHADYTRVSAPRRIKGLSLKPKENDTLKNILEQRQKDRVVADEKQKEIEEKSESDFQSLLDPTLVTEAIAGKRRYALINVWRNIQHDPVYRSPLACVDARTMPWSDLRTFQIHYADRVGENYFVCPSSPTVAGHKWWYFPRMVMDEALLLKQWDSSGGIAQGENVDNLHSTFTVHSAIVDPTCPVDAPARESIEVRLAVIWGNE